MGNNPKEEGFDFSVNKYEIGIEKGHFDEKGDYLTDRFTNDAVQFITENKNNPFFLYLAHDAVHTPIQAKKDIISKYEKICLGKYKSDLIRQAEGKKGFLRHMQESTQVFKVEKMRSAKLNKRYFITFKKTKLGDTNLSIQLLFAKYLSF